MKMASVSSLLSSSSLSNDDLLWVMTAPKTGTVSGVVCIVEPRWNGTRDALVRLANITNVHGVRQVGAGDEFVCSWSDLTRFQLFENYHDLKRYLAL